ncbi:hypothetical protein EV645_6507 [Kribbella rubisoli]|uniref:CARDB domain-containing protein n=1 Tax=Kribbella rubisoli TaxID=3075929 RepID=A0A4Q7WMN4_9ACTN|nr:hypothetical protein [Kribbella rubisoli]RZU11341.1 hypothetical protein EV645_6507 [Kribbella rubisoli]
MGRRSVLWRIIVEVAGGVITMNAGQPEKQPPAALVPTLLAIAGSVTGTLVTMALDKSPGLKLLGAALGAAIPPLIAAFGSFSRLQLVGGLGVAGLALLVTYLAFVVPETALGKETTFPVPGPQPTQTVTPPDPTTRRPNPTELCEGQLCIGVTPKELHCTEDHCDAAVEVISGGKTTLRIGDIEFKGDIAERFSQTGDCRKHVLHRLETCQITVHVAPGEGGTAQMRIHQNLKAPASAVRLEADTWTTTPEPTDTPDPTVLGLLPDFTLSTALNCTVVPKGQSSTIDSLTVFVPVLNRGPGGHNRLVPFRLRSNTGLSDSGETAFNAPDATRIASTAMQVELSSGDYGRSHVFTVTVDPNNEIAEADESNNLLRLRVSLPSRPQQIQDVPCPVL